MRMQTKISFWHAFVCKKHHASKRQSFMILWSEGLFGSFRFCLAKHCPVSLIQARAPTAPDATPRGSVCGWMTARPAEEWLYLKGIYRAKTQLHFDPQLLCLDILTEGPTASFSPTFSQVAIHSYRLDFFKCNSFVWEEGKNHQVKRTLVVRSLRREVNFFQSYLEHFYRGRDVIGTGRLHCTMVDVLAP